MRRLLSGRPIPSLPCSTGLSPEHGSWHAPPSLLCPLCAGHWLLGPWHPPALYPEGQERPVPSAVNNPSLIAIWPREPAGHLPHPYSLATVRQVQPHDSVVRLQKGCVDSQIGWGPRIRLDIDSPLCRIQVKGLQGPTLTQQLDFIHYLCSPIVSAMGWGQIRAERKVPPSPSK